MVLLLCLSQAKAIEPERRDLIHHPFNSSLLAKKELQASLWSGLKFGVTPNLEIGAYLYSWSVGLHSLHLKHKMFDFDNVRVSFSSLSLLKYESSDDFGFLSLFGVNTGLEFGDFTVNLGVYDLFFKRDSSGDQVTAHNLAPALGFDYLLLDNFGLTAYAFFPVYKSADVKSDYLDATFEGKLKGLGPENIVFAGGNFFFGGLSLELGGIFKDVGGNDSDSSELIPYGNVVWRL